MNLLFLRAPKAPAPGFAHPDELIRSELFSVERLEQHGETLAVAQRVTDYPGRGRPIAARVSDNGRALLEAYRDIAGAIREERAITPAAEWLVDNFHVVEEQIREIRDDLPRGYYRQLPKLADGPLEGYPRVFGIAWAYVAHTDSYFDPQTLVEVRAGVPARATVDDRRVVGGGDHASNRAGRKSASSGGTNRPRPRATVRRRSDGEPAAGNQRPGTGTR